MMITGGQTLREAERRAKQGRTGIWHDYVQPASAATKLSDDFRGIVFEVVSGDIICVKDTASGKPSRTLDMPAYQVVHIYIPGSRVLYRRLYFLDLDGKVLSSHCCTI